MPAEVARETAYRSSSDRNGPSAWFTAWSTPSRCRSRDLRREAPPVERQADLPAFGERTRPDLVSVPVDDVERRALGVEHVRRRDGDAQEDLVDVRLEREVALELEQRFELLGLARRCHHGGFLLNWSAGARGRG